MVTASAGAVVQAVGATQAAVAAAPVAPGTDWIMIAAVILGPIFAVQAQKFLERLRERANQKVFILGRLVATRSKRASDDHAVALNMIEFVFYGHKILWWNYQSKVDKAVVEAWREYFTHLNSDQWATKQEAMLAKNDELFTNLLLLVARAAGYNFPRTHLASGHYAPKGEIDFNNDQARLRQAAIDVLTGRAALKMELTSLLGTTILPPATIEQPKAEHLQEPERG